MPLQSFADQNTAAIQTRVVGGIPVGINVAPWQVALINKASFTNNYDGQYCGGSIISARWVVTAAHCVVDISPGDPMPFVLAGTSELSRSGFSSNLIQVNQIIVHPNFVSAEFGDDIALLKLNTPLTFIKNSIEPILVSTRTPQAGTKGFVSGWGNVNGTNDLASAPTYPTQLQGADVYIQPMTTNSTNTGCVDLLNFYGATDDTSKYLCASGYDGSGNPKVDTCQGDSGGPLAAAINGAWNLIGITSWGAGCAWEFPGVYTNVANYSNWISRNATDLLTLSLPLPIFSEPVRTSDGFTTNITNYSQNSTYKVTLIPPSAGKVRIGAPVNNAGTLVLPLSVTGAKPSAFTNVKVDVSQRGFLTSTGTITGQALAPQVTAPRFSKPVRTKDGFTVSITNYSSQLHYEYSIVTPVDSSVQGVVSNSNLLITVSSVQPGNLASLSVVVSNEGYRDSIGLISERALLSGNSPNFSSFSSNSNGFSFNITNYSQNFRYKISIVSPNRGKITTGKSFGVSKSNLPVTVSNLIPGSTAVIKVEVTQNGYATESKMIEWPSLNIS